MRRAGEKLVQDVATNLTKHICSGERAEMRDVYCVGMTHAITQVAPAHGAVLVKVVLPGMLGGITEGAPDMQRDCLQVTRELLKRFGDKDPSQHDRAIDVLLAALQGGESDVCKRATSAMGALSQHINDEQLGTVITRVLDLLQKASSAEGRQAAIRTISAVARTVGYRLGQHLGEIVPLFLGCIGDAEDEAAMTDSGNDLREACFQALEAFVLRCPAEVTGHLDTITDVAVQFLDFDPNFDYDAMESDDEYGSDDDEGLDMDDEYGEYDEVEVDDDTSWKVRRGAVAVLTGIISTRPERLHDAYAKIASPLLVQFREREQTVRVDVLKCFVALLKATVVVEGSAADRVSGASAPAGSSEAGAVPVAPPAPLQPAPLVRQRSAGPTLNAMVSSIVAEAIKLLGKTEARDVKTRAACFNVLGGLVLASGHHLELEVGSLLGAVPPALADGNTSVRQAALLMVRQMPDCIPATAFPEHMSTLCDIAVKALSDSWFKSVAEGLRISGRMALLMHSTGSKDAGLVDTLFGAILPKLAAADLDQEIKEMAITSMGLLVAHLGDVLGPKVAQTYPLFLRRLAAETTRIAALKALTHVAESPLGLDLSSVAVEEGGTVLEAIVEQCIALTRQASWQLVHASLGTLTAITASHGSHLAPTADALVDATAAILAGSDLNLAQNAVRLACAVLEHVPRSAAGMHGKALAPSIKLVASPALKGAALDDCKAFFHALVTKGGADPKALAQALSASVEDGAAGAAASGSGTAAAPVAVQKQTVLNIASVSAVVLRAGGEGSVQGAITGGLAAVKDDAMPDAQRSVALHILADVGAAVDVLSATPAALDTIVSAFTCESDIVRMAAAAAMGGVAVGSPSVGLVSLLQSLSTAAEGGHYLLLSALQGVLKRHAPVVPHGPDFTPHVASVLPVLNTRAGADDEGERTVVAECLGLLVGISPSQCLHELEAMAASDSPNKRWTSVTAIKGCLHSSTATEALDSAGVMSTFMGLLQDADLNVRLGAVQALHALVHSAPELVRGLFLPTALGTSAAGKVSEKPEGSIEEVGIMPVLCYEMQPHEELQRKVDVGPFKVDVDDGEALRKAAFVTLDSVVQHLRERVSEVAMERVVAGLMDVDDVKLLAHQVLVRLTQYDATRALVLGFLKSICEQFQATFQAAAKAAKGSSGGATDVMRSALRAIHSIDKHVPDARSTREFAGLVASCEAQEPLASLLKQIRSDLSA